MRSPRNPVRFSTRLRGAAASARERHGRGVRRPAARRLSRTKAPMSSRVGPKLTKRVNQEDVFSSTAWITTPCSSRRRSRSQVGAAACHTTRAAATSGRSCSEGRTVFFDGHVQSRHRAPDRRPAAADVCTWYRARRPKPCRLATSAALRALVAAKLAADWSPQQIAGWLKQTFPDHPHLQVSHETILRECCSCKVVAC